MRLPKMILFDDARTLAGLFPVWYEETAIPNGFAKKNAELTIAGPHLHIHPWDELSRQLDQCE